MCTDSRRNWYQGKLILSSSRQNTFEQSGNRLQQGVDPHLSATAAPSGRVMNTVLPEDMVQTFFAALTQLWWDGPRDKTLHRYEGPNWAVCVLQPTVNNLTHWVHPPTRETQARVRNLSYRHVCLQKAALCRLVGEVLHTAAALGKPSQCFMALTASLHCGWCVRITFFYTEWRGNATISRVYGLYGDCDHRESQSSAREPSHRRP